MSQESFDQDEIRFRYLEQHFYMLLSVLALAVVPQAIGKEENLPRLLAVVLGTPLACFAASWLSSRGRWLSKSEDSDDPRYSHFLDLGGFTSISGPVTLSTRSWNWVVGFLTDWEELRRMAA